MLAAGRVVDESLRHVVPSITFSHAGHHSGPLTVSLRLNGVPVPPVCGPTADERAFSADLSRRGDSMTTLNLVVSAVDVAVSAVFAVFVFLQFARRRSMHQLMWGIAIALWAVAVAAELTATLRGRWGMITYRAYYATGALLIPAWLGMGTLYLISPRRGAAWILGVLSVLSATGILLIGLWPIDSHLLYAVGAGQLPLRVFPFFPVQALLIVLNTLGAAAFILGALWTVVLYARKRSSGARAFATVLIAIGGIVAAVAHSMGVLSGIELFRVSELVAVVLIFVGFLLSNGPAVQAGGAKPQET